MLRSKDGINKYTIVAQSPKNVPISLIHTRFQKHLISQMKGFGIIEFRYSYFTIFINQPKDSREPTLDILIILRVLKKTHFSWFTKSFRSDNQRRTYIKYVTQEYVKTNTVTRINFASQRERITFNPRCNTEYKLSTTDLVFY